MNPVLSKELEEELNISGPVVRSIIRQFRRSGEPIVASEKGYYLASNPQEVSLIVEDLRKRIKSMGETVSKLQQKSYERFETQKEFQFSSGSHQVQKAIKGGADEVRKDSQEEGRSRRLLYVQPGSKQNPPGHIHGKQQDFTLDDLLRSR